MFVSVVIMVNLFHNAEITMNQCGLTFIDVVKSILCFILFNEHFRLFVAGNLIGSYSNVDTTMI